MKQTQRITLDKSDMEKLKRGEVLDISYPGGKIELDMEKARGAGMAGKMGYPENRIIKENVAKLLEERKIPMLTGDISKELGITSPQANSAIHKLSAQKRVINSAAGWRCVFDTTAKIKPSLAHSNGHAKGK